MFVACVRGRPPPPATSIRDTFDTFFYVIVWKCGSEKKKTTASSRRSGLGNDYYGKQLKLQKLPYARPRSDYEV